MLSLPCMCVLECLLFCCRFGYCCHGRLCCLLYFDVVGVVVVVGVFVFVMVVLIGVFRVCVVVVVVVVLEVVVDDNCGVVEDVGVVVLLWSWGMLMMLF